MISICQLFLVTLLFVGCKGGPTTARTQASPSSIERQTAIRQQWERISKQMQLGDFDEAWRFSTIAIRRDEFQFVDSGCNALTQLCLKMNQPKAPALAILESRMINADGLDYQSRAVLLLTCQLILGQGLDKAEYQKCEEILEECERTREVGIRARTLCEENFAEKSLDKKLACADLLLYATEVGGSAREWAVTVAKNELTKSDAKPARILILLFELIAQKFYSRDFTFK